MPFAVVGSDKEYQVNNKRVLGRKTPWGIVEGERRGLSFLCHRNNVDGKMLSIDLCIQCKICWFLLNVLVAVENPNHCEFAQLRDFLIR